VHLGVPYSFNDILIIIIISKMFSLGYTKIMISFELLEDHICSAFWLQVSLGILGLLGL
jgi:hypothetical protein